MQEVFFKFICGLSGIACVMLSCAEVELMHPESTRVYWKEKGSFHFNKIDCITFVFWSTILCHLKLVIA